MQLEREANTKTMKQLQSYETQPEKTLKQEPSRHKMYD